MLTHTTLLATFLLSATAQAQATRPYSLLKPEVLAELKSLPPTDPALVALKDKADKLLTVKPPSVMEKPDPLPVPGDRHDYMSLARYYWPNPKTETGLPYVQRDGETNESTLR